MRVPGRHCAFLACARLGPRAGPRAVSAAANARAGAGAPALAPGAPALAPSAPAELAGTTGPSPVHAALPPSPPTRDSACLLRVLGAAGAAPLALAGDYPLKPPALRSDLTLEMLCNSLFYEMDVLDKLSVLGACSGRSIHAHPLSVL